ncbi:carboxymuconolactone decarboxylase family protein [Croceicoccus sp. Ery5]|uniref:carboxymuconolactone decarboxylase family protein n=1 Tax=Croceicoccus sp. Ery5 TaxID=1703340 RepID=UPI001E56DDBF|nr:hypothetical protein [Croceicoccus sp. Ery5]
MTRFPAIAEQDRDADQQRMADKATHGGPFPVFQQAPLVWEALQELRQCLARSTTLSRAEREAAMLAIARHWRSSAGFAAHAKLARDAGLDDDLILSLAKGEASLAKADRRLQAIVAMVFALLRTGQLTDSQFEAAQDALGKRGMVELVGLTGFFTTTCLALNLGAIGDSTVDFG